MKELKELSTISEPGEEFINLSLERCRKHDEVAKEHVGYVMRSVYQSCINLGYALLAKKCIKLKTCEIYDKLTELEETKEYVSFLKDLKYSMRNEDYSRLKEYLEKFESMKELLKIFE